MGYGIHLLDRLRSKVGRSELLKVYNTIIQPHVDYCITVWGYASMYHIEKIQRLQNRIARIIANNYDHDISPSVILCELGIMNILQRRDYFMSTLMYRCINGSAPTYLTDRIDYGSTYNSYCTRTSNQLMLHVPNHE